MRIIKPAKVDCTQSLGNGGYACVFKGQLQVNDQILDIAVKRTYLYDSKRGTNFPKQVKDKLIELTMKEIQILAKCNHPHIVKYYDYFQSETYIDIYLELCDGSLKEQLTLPLDPHYAFEIFAQILSATLYLQKLDFFYNNERYIGIYHRDLNLKNTLMINGKVKLTDFGLSRQSLMEDSMVSYRKGTPMYMSPQNYNRLQYNLEKNDVWSMGVVLYQLLHQYYFDVEAAQNEMLTYRSQDEQTISLLKSMLSVEEELRPTFHELSIHPCVKETLKNVEQFSIEHVKDEIITKENKFLHLVESIQMKNLNLQNELLDFIRSIHLTWLYQLKVEYNNTEELYLLVDNYYQQQEQPTHYYDRSDQFYFLNKVPSLSDELRDYLKN